MTTESTAFGPSASTLQPPVRDPKPFLRNYLSAVASDGLFVLCSTQRADSSALADVASRRSTLYSNLVQGGTPDSVGWPADWFVSMCVAMAPVAQPLWIPMHECIDAFSLESGARGVRSLFAKKPSEKQVDRARTVGAFVVRSMASVLGATSTWSDDSELMRRCLVVSFGLPEQDAALLCQEAPMVPGTVELPSDVDVKTARMIARGIWRAAFRDGLDPCRDDRAVELCQRMGLTADDTESLRKVARDEVELNKAFGPAAVDAVRVVLSDDEAGVHLSRVVAHLALLPVHRSETLSSIDHGGVVVLARRHTLDRKQVEACLALSWLAALWTNPDQTRLAEFIVRHDRVAGDLGSKPDGSSARALATSFVLDQLAFAVQAGGL